MYLKPVKTQPKGIAHRVGTVLDKALGVAFPKWALQRRTFREMQGILDAGKGRGRKMFNSYRGSESTRLRQEWLPGGRSADDDLLPELKSLRQRSRDLIRNDPHASGLMVTMETNVVGRGIKPQSRVTSAIPGISEDQAALIREQCEAAFMAWALASDSTDKLNFWDQESLALRQTLENGDSFPHFVSLPEKSYRPLGLGIEIIEADRVETPPGDELKKNIRHGIEFDDKGEPVTYHVREGHPGDVQFRKDNNTDTIPIPARAPASTDPMQRRNIIHLSRQLRAGQSRGIPYLSPAMTMFKDLSDYLEAELVAARIAACYALFITTEDPATVAIRDFDRLNTAGQYETDLEPGMIRHLAPGESIESFNPNRGGDSFGPYVERMLRSIGVAIGFPMEIFAKDFSRTNYSSARAALLEARRVFRVWQQWLSIYFCQPSYERVTEEAFLRGMIPAIPSGDVFYAYYDQFTAAQWIAPSWDWVDPQKEVKAAVLALNAGLTSRTKVAASQGDDIMETLEELAREQEAIQELSERAGAPILLDVPAAVEEEEDEDEEEIEDAD